MDNNGSTNGTTHYRTAVVDGIDIAYREAGPKDAPVVLQPGTSTCTASRIRPVWTQTTGSWTPR
jgi:hypothetical protein